MNRGLLRITKDHGDEKTGPGRRHVMLQWRLSLANHSPSNSSCKTRGAPQNASYKSELPENKFRSQSRKLLPCTRCKVPRSHLGWFTTFAPLAVSITNRRSLFFFTLVDGGENPPSPANNQDYAKSLKKLWKSTNQSQSMNIFENVIQSMKVNTN